MAIEMATTFAETTFSNWWSMTAIMENKLPPWKLYISAADEAAKQGKSEQSDLLYERAIAVAEELLGTKNKDFGVVLSTVADTYAKKGNFIRAKSLYKKAVNVYESSLGGSHPVVALALRNLAEVYSDMGQHEEAELHRRRVTSILKDYLT